MLDQKFKSSSLLIWVCFWRLRRTKRIAPTATNTAATEEHAMMIGVDVLLLEGSSFVPTGTLTF
jgi:hypothetical protein